MNKPRILHVLYSGQGGLGSYFMGFVNDDAQSHFEHHALFYGVDELFADYKEFCRMKNIPFVFRKRGRKIDLENYRYTAAYAESQSISAVVIHTASMTPSAWFLRKENIPVFFIDHTNPDFKNRIEKIYTAIGFLLADRFFYFIDAQIDALKKMFPLINSTSTKLIKLRKTADLSRFYTGTRNRGKGPLIFGMAARMVPGKLQKLLIEAAAELVQEGYSLRLRLVGEGPEKDGLMQLAETAGVGEWIEFPGSLTAAGMLSFYHNLDVYVHATIGETICLSILEAQACGLPVIASNVPGVRDVLEHRRTALLFENSRDELRKALLAILTEPGLSDVLRDASMKATELNRPEKDVNVIFRLLAGRTV